MTLARQAGIGAAAVGALILMLAVAVYGLSEARLRATPEIPSFVASSSTDADPIERGEHIAFTRGCAGCHAEDFGGRLLIDVPVFAVIGATNLTGGRGGLPPSYTEEDWERAIRHGIGHDGRALALMPAETYFGFGDADVAALTAYLRSLPAVDRELPERRFGPVGRSLLALERLPIFSARTIDHFATRRSAPPEGETVEFGGYLAAICTSCHGADHTGGRIAGSPADHPAAPNLTPHPETGLADWNEGDFFRALREGRRPDGSKISIRYMPWGATARMTDVEIRALWLFFSSLPARESGDR